MNMRKQKTNKRHEKQGCYECGRIGTHEPGCRFSAGALIHGRTDTKRAQWIANVLEMPIKDIVHCSPEFLKGAEILLKTAALESEH